ncbi:MAG: 30S ribosomal protein S20 [Phycisphaeraceae bacterium]|nr:30S ribosomal protein S20 [Phycisphaeraceae bacterium]
MAHSASAKKRIRQNEKHRARNRWRLKTMRTAIKELQDKLLHGTPADAEAAYAVAAKIIDRTAAKGVIHKNQAARRKSRLTAKVKSKKAAKA